MLTIFDFSIQGWVGVSSLNLQRTLKGRDREFCIDGTYFLEEACPLEVSGKVVYNKRSWWKIS